MIFLESIDSTHAYLKTYVEKNGYQNPLCVLTDHQTKGIGSRENSWQGKKGNLFFSFVYPLEFFPNDIPLQSYSIYFSFVLKQLLEKKGSKVWLKWPNDFYLEKKKIGGTITHFKDGKIYCGIGINLLFMEEDYGFLDIIIEPENLLKDYFSILEQKMSWKQIFSKYLLEFAKSKDFLTTVENKKVSLQNAILNDDGSITIGTKKVFSLR